MIKQDNTQSLRDVLIEQVYGTESSQPKSDAEVLRLIKQIGRGIALDEVLNIWISPEQMANLVESEIITKVAAITEANLNDHGQGTAHNRFEATNAVADEVADNERTRDAFNQAVNSIKSLTYAADTPEPHIVAQQACVLSQIIATVPYSKTYRYAVPPNIAERICEYVKDNLTLDEMVSHILSEFKVQVCASRLRNHLRFGLGSIKRFRERPLKPCYPIIYVEVEYVRMLTNATLIVEHPFYFLMGMNFEGDREMLAIAPFPRNYQEEGVQAKMWQEVFEDLKKRGLLDPIYVVTGNVHEFAPVLKQVYPQAIYQHSLMDIMRQAMESLNTAERAKFSNQFKLLYNARSLLECMHALASLENLWKDTHPECIQFIRDHFVFFEQYFAAHKAVRSCIRNTKGLGQMLNDVRRDIRCDRNYMYSDARAVTARVLEIYSFVSKSTRPVQWKRALKYMLDDSYIGKILGKYLSVNELNISWRSLRRDELEQKRHTAELLHGSIN